jgi:hypothetical protein
LEADVIRSGGQSDLQTRRKPRARRSALISAAVVAAFTLAIGGPSSAASQRPQVHGVSPRFASAAGGTMVTITGKNLAGTTAVMFGSTPAASFTVNSAKSITAVSPPDNAGSAPVTVTTPEGTSRAKLFDIVPAVTGVSPDVGPTAGGTIVTVTGAGFVSGVTSFRFGRAQATGVTCTSTTTCEAVTPAHAVGPIAVTVAGVKRKQAIGTNFTYEQPPIVTGVNPNEGPVAGGTSVIITGENFSGATAVKFGAAQATSFTVESATSITAVSPMRSAGTVDVTVENGIFSTKSPADQFTYVRRPSVTAVSPNIGPEGGGTSVEIVGEDLAGATAVKFGSTNATSFKVNSAESISAVSPAGSGVVDVTVTTVGGTSRTGLEDQFSYVP